MRFGPKSAWGVKKLPSPSILACLTHITFSVHTERPTVLSSLYNEIDVSAETSLDISLVAGAESRFLILSGNLNPPWIPPVLRCQKTGGSAGSSIPRSPSQTKS